MNDKVIIETFLEKLNKGEIALNEIPQGWRDKVLLVLNEEE